MARLKNKLHHEHWPAPLFYTPVFFYYLYNSIKLRKFNYFSAVNPALETGGLCGFSKYDSFKLVSPELLPKTLLLEKRYYDQKELHNLLEREDLSFPLIAKPDQGERGFLVSKLDDLDKLHFYLKDKSSHIKFLLQDYVAYPLEVGVFLVNRNKKWQVTSLTSKRFWSVRGDGQSTISELIKEKGDGKELHDVSINPFDVPALGEEVILEHIGNHCRGTDFINSCDQIDAQLNETFNKKLKDVHGLRYTRIDLRTPDWKSLKQGQFKIMEINGVSAEPGHIYDAKTPLKQAYKDLFSHWSVMAQIAKEEMAGEEPPEKFSETFKKVMGHLEHKKDFKTYLEKNAQSVESCKNLNLKQDPKEILKSFDGEDLIKNHTRFQTPMGYERVTLFEDHDVEIVFCRWLPHNESPVHFHPNKECYFRCLKGRVLEKRTKAKTQTVLEAEDIGHINDSIDSHQMVNQWDDSAYTLHLYQRAQTQHI